MTATTDESMWVRVPSKSGAYWHSTGDIYSVFVGQYSIHVNVSDNASMGLDDLGGWWWSEQIQPPPTDAPEQP